MIEQLRKIYEQVDVPDWQRRYEMRAVVQCQLPYSTALSNAYNDEVSMTEAVTPVAAANLSLRVTDVLFGKNPCRNSDFMRVSVTAIGSNRQEVRLFPPEQQRLFEPLLLMTLPFYRFLFWGVVAVSLIVLGWYLRGLDVGESREFVYRFVAGVGVFLAGVISATFLICRASREIVLIVLRREHADSLVEVTQELDELIDYACDREAWDEVLPDYG